ncbi:MAG TPA: hypothetical protein PKE12_07335 [Kiritimatiellia bacterium]|nr:hypothetical protein [Kiritimatiellia bacterium]
MNAFFLRDLLRGGCLNLVFLTLTSASLIQDDFNGSMLDTNQWGTAYTGGAAAPVQTGGGLMVHVETNSQNQRALVFSTRTDLDFTARPITMAATISALGGAGAVQWPVNRYLLIGSFGTQPEIQSRYYPGSELPMGVWLAAGQTNGMNYLEVGTVRLGRVETTREIYQGVLTAMSLTLHGNTYSVSASGIDGFSVGADNRIVGVLANIHTEEYNGHFRFAMGAANSFQGAVSEGASVVWDSVTVNSALAP